MSIYRFAGASPVREIAFRYANDRPPFALLEASPQASEAQLSTLRRALDAHRFPCVPVHFKEDGHVEGRDALQVTGFADEGQLVALLHELHVARGQPRIQAEAGDHPTQSWKEWLKGNSLSAGGWANLVGDGALLISGLKSGRRKETITGALYTAGGFISARYGNVRTERHLRDVSGQLAEFLRHQAGNLPEHCGLFSILKDARGGNIRRFEDFLYRYPAETTLGVYTLGALSMLQSGLKHGKFWDTAYGASSVAIKIASLAVPEKPRDEAAAPEGPLGGLIQWVQEKPLRIFGYGNMISDSLLGMSAYREYKANPRQRSYIFKFLTSGTYLLADMMFAVSSKDKTGAENKFDAEEQRRIEALAAETIAAQPEAIRAPLMHQVAGFLSQRPEMNGTAQDIAAAIGEQVEHMGKNKWACVSKITQRAKGAGTEAQMQR